MDNVQGSIEMDSNSDEEIKPANLSDEFEEITMVVPTDEEEVKDFDEAGPVEDDQ